MEGYKTVLLIGFIFLYLGPPITGEGTFHNLKKGFNLQERVAQLKQLSSKSPLIKLNGIRFREFIKTSPKNYSFIVMMTALRPQRQCGVCGPAFDEFKILADSYKLKYGSNGNLFFGYVDFDEGSDVFQTLHLSTAPVVIHFPSHGKVKNADTMDMQRIGFSAEAVSRWILERTDIDILVLRPGSQGTTILLVIMITILVIFTYFQSDYVSFLHSKTLWAVGAVIFSLAMTSGQMWNHIRNPPFYYQHPSGAVSYIHGSSQGQFIVETHIVFLINLGFVASIIAIIEMGAHMEKNGPKNKLITLSVCCLICAVLLYSLLLSIFRAKAGGYPYRALF